MTRLNRALYRVHGHNGLLTLPYCCAECTYAPAYFSPMHLLSQDPSNALREAHSHSYPDALHARCRSLRPTDELIQRLLAPTKSSTNCRSLVFGLCNNGYRAELPAEQWVHLRKRLQQSWKWSGDVPSYIVAQLTSA